MLDIGKADLKTDRAQRRDGYTWKLLYVGNLEAEKGTPELLAAIRILANRGLAVEVDLVGNSVDPRMDRQIEMDKNANPGIHFRGTIDDRDQVKDYFLNADLFVFPSHSEGFPRVLYEAMCYGLPIVTTMVDGIPSLMHSGLNCIAVPVGDAPALADAIAKALLDISLREKLAAGGLATMRKLFDDTRKSHAEQVIERIRRVSAAGSVEISRQRN
jgi:glycosyltransferase involved in cell wall biosynthesis